jgi:hypothetical protein
MNRYRRKKVAIMERIMEAKAAIQAPVVEEKVEVAVEPQPIPAPVVEEVVVAAVEPTPVVEESPVPVIVVEPQPTPAPVVTTSKKKKNV